MISDLDEIPDPGKIKKFNVKNKYVFLTEKFPPKINLINRTVQDWPGTKICQEKKFKVAPMAKKYKGKKKTVLEVL